MEKLNTKLLIKEAGEKLTGKDAGKLALFHTGITVAVALAITLLQYGLSAGIGNTSGLSGLGTRSILETVQMVLQWANTILTPFWSLGFLYAALRWARGGNAAGKDLLRGFHRMGPCLGLLANRMLLCIAVMLLCANLSSIVYMMTPAAAALSQIAAEAGNDVNALNEILNTMTWEDTVALLDSMIPLLAIWGILCLVLLVPLMYRFRMAEYVILDEPQARGLSSMLLSAALLRRRCWQLLKLDLQFWWYYGLKGLCLLICYADLLLGMVGISLPIGGDGACFISYLVYLAALLGVETCFRPRVDTAYACAYGRWKDLGPVAKKTPEPPKNMPWDEEA